MSLEQVYEFLIVLTLKGEVHVEGLMVVPSFDPINMIILYKHYDN
jgi:hypothetical protein